MNALFWLIEEVINLYWWAVLLAVVFSNLISFNVLDQRNRVVWTISDFLFRLTEPALRPIRNVLPYFGGIDISPIVLLLLLTFLWYLVRYDLRPALMPYGLP